MIDLDDRMNNADPAKGLSDANLSPTVLAMWERAQSASPSPSRRRKWRVAIPVIAVALVTTGAAVAVPRVLLSMGEPDVQIPISYETASGTTVSCAYALYLGDDVRTPEDEHVATVLAGTDWTGLGQDIHDYAVSNPRVPQDGEVWTSDSVEMRDAISFKLAVVPMIERRLPSDLQGVVEVWRMSDTCIGPFR